MLQHLKTYLTDKGYTLTQANDCYNATSPSGKQALVNLRWKTRPVWGKVAKRWEWSIPFRQWQQYIKHNVKLLFVLEKSTGIIHVANLQDITPQARIYPGSDMDHGGTVFLPVDGYKQVGTVTI